jgi:hypothetical protein
VIKGGSTQRKTILGVALSTIKCHKQCPRSKPAHSQRRNEKPLAWPSPRRTAKPLAWPSAVECVWKLMAYGDAREGKWKGNWRMEWVASTLTLPRNVVYPALLTLMRTHQLPAVEWTDAPADINGLVRFGERRNLVSARMSSEESKLNTTKTYFCEICVSEGWRQLHYWQPLICIPTGNTINNLISHSSCYEFW